MKILSQGKFREFDGFEKTSFESTVLLTFENTKIECTADHKFLRDDNVWVEAKDIKSNEMYNKNRFIKLEETKEKKEVYDAINVKNTSSFYAEGITSHNCSFLYIDETAHLNNWDEFFASVYPTISSGKNTKILLTSTPNSLNHFWKICKEAQEDVDDLGQGKNGYKYIEVSWERVPGRDEEWKDKTLASISWNNEQFQQEFCCVFPNTNVFIRNKETQEIQEVTMEELYYLIT